MTIVGDQFLQVPKRQSQPQPTKPYIVSVTVDLLEDKFVICIAWKNAISLNLQGILQEFSGKTAAMIHSFVLDHQRCYYEPDDMSWSRTLA